MELPDFLDMSDNKSNFNRTIKSVGEKTRLTEKKSPQKKKNRPTVEIPVNGDVEYLQTPDR